MSLLVAEGITMKFSGITALDARVMTGHVSETVEERVTLNGVERTWLVTKVPTLDDYGEVTGLLEISRDITARKKTERALHAVLEEQKLARMAALSLMEDSVAAQRKAEEMG